MFYLGSIAGILPYLLAFSLTIVLGGHAGLPFFKSATVSEPINEVSKAEQFNLTTINDYHIDNKVVKRKIETPPVLFSVKLKIENFYLCRFIKAFEAGTSLLRAPPVIILQ